MIQVVLLLIALSTSRQYSDNFIVNGNFSEDKFSGVHQYFPKGITGWSCSKMCQIDNCTFSRYWSFPACEGMVIDLNSANFNQIVSQQTYLKSGDYLLSFDYYYPQYNASLKYLNVTFNNQNVLSVNPQTNGISQPFISSTILEGKQGLNIISFQNSGYFEDSEGFKINNIGLVRILNQNIQNLVQAFFSFTYIQYVSSFPGGRVFFRSLFSFLINLDRYQFYAYHNRIYSYNQELLLGSINKLQSIKGQLFKNVQRNLFSNFIQAEQQFFDSLNFKSGYIIYNSFEKQISKDTFSQYISHFAIYSLPAIIIIFIFLNILFRLLFNLQISKFLRQFSFYGILLPLFLEGNIEELTFYIFAELKIFFSFNLKHKLFNILTLAVFFIVVIACFGAHLIFLYHYRRKAKYLIDSINSSLTSIISQNFDRGVIVFLYGATHQLMINNPTPQLAVLGLLEIILISKQIITRKKYENSLLLIVLISRDFLRIFFQITTYLYSIMAQERKNINHNYHKYLIILLIFQICLQIFTTACIIIKRILKSNKIKNVQIQIRRKRKCGNRTCIRGEKKSFFIKFKFLKINQ